jgi:hypothetical protein
MEAVPSAIISRRQKYRLEVCWSILIDTAVLNIISHRLPQSIMLSMISQGHSLVIPIVYMYTLPRDKADEMKYSYEFNHESGSLS